MREVKKNRRITLDELQVECSLQHVSTDTISARIHDLLDFQSYWTDLNPLLTKQHKENRLKWATEHLGWTSEQWERVLWSDESPFTVSFQGRERVWRGANERYIVEAITPTRKSDQKINVWGCFASNGVGKLVLIDGLMDAKQYVKIIEKNVPRTARKLFGFDDYLFQQDNDPKHTSERAYEAFDRLGIEVMEWPAQSPDLNPIENLWSYLDRKCKHRRCRNAEELFRQLCEAWNSLDLEYLGALVGEYAEKMSSCD